MTTALLDFETDVQMGLNVREYHYRDITEEFLWELEIERDGSFESRYEYDDEREEIYVPFVVMLWDDGLDYDEDGNAYFDDAPGWFTHTCHRTLKGAEIEMAWLEHHGITNDKHLAKDAWIPRWELKSHPLQD